MDDLRSVVLYRHPTTVFTATVTLLTLLTFSSAPSFIPIVVLVATVQVYARILLPRNHAFLRGLLLWIAITSAASLTQLRPSIHALSTPGTSIAVLLALSATSSLIALGIIFFDVRVCMQFDSPWSQIAFFPALWASVWCGVSYLSPIGRLAIWSPVVGMSQYSWLMQWVGPPGIDWLVGAWALVVSQSIGAWFMGAENPDDRIQLVDIDSSESRSSTKSTSRNVLYLASTLVLLTVPAFISNDLPLPAISPNTTPLIVGCVIPPHRRYKHRHLTLHDFIEESKKIASANIILWPEGAVTFRDAEERDLALKEIGSVISKAYIGVSFEEYYSDSDDSRGRRTGIALISPGDSTPRLTYYKRHLVPIAESFSLTHSTRPPSIDTLELTKPRDYNKTDWAPPPNYTRPIPITASICLDFAAPSAFIDLESRPGLILAPARTWHTAIGTAMWEQAKQRASELGSAVLWCDGGEGGVSGIAGYGMSEVTQVGEGSWAREVGIPYPLRTSRTLYARIGDVPVLVFLCAIVSLGMLSEPRRLVGISIAINWSRIGDIWEDFRGMVRGWRRRDDPEMQHLLDG